MWILQRLLRIPWVDKVANKEMLRRAEVDREIFQMIKQPRAHQLASGGATFIHAKVHCPPLLSRSLSQHRSAVASLR